MFSERLRIIFFCLLVPGVLALYGGIAQAQENVVANVPAVADGPESVNETVVDKQEAPAVDVRALVAEALALFSHSIEAEVGKYDVLDHFDGQSIKVNAHGFSEIAYSRPLGQRTDFELLVHVVPLKVRDPLEKKPGHGKAVFPLLDVKMLWAVTGNMYVKTLDIGAIFRKSLTPLREAEQSMLPLSLAVDSEQAIYHSGDVVEFDLVLKNKSDHALKVRELDQHSLACSFNEEKWGSGSGKNEPKLVLSPEGTLRKRIKLLGVKNSGDLNVSCTYNMGLKGALPLAERVFRING